MAEENRAPENEQPLAEPVHEQRLARPVRGDQEDTTRAEGEDQVTSQTKDTHEEQQEAPQVEAEQEKRGLVDKTLDKAQEKGLISGSTAEKAREKGLVGRVDEAIDKAVEKAREKGLTDKVDEALAKARNKLSGR